MHSVADSRFCNILFGAANTERTNHFSQPRNRGGVSFRFTRVSFFFVFCFLLFFPFVHRGLIIDYRSLSKASFQLTRNAHFIFIDGCRFQSGTRYFASLLFSLDSATCNSQIIARMLSQLNPEISRNAARPAQLFMGDGGQVIRRPIAFPLHSL